MEFVPAEMAKPCLTQTQTTRSRADQLRSQQTQIRFVPHKQTRAFQALHQGPWIPARLKTAGDLNLRSHATFHSQLSRFVCSSIRTAIQALGAESEIAQTAAHLECARKAQRREAAFGMIHPLVALNRDAVTH